MEKLVGQSEFQKIDKSFFEKMEKTERAKLETEDLANSQGMDFNSPAQDELIWEVQLKYRPQIRLGHF